MRLPTTPATTVQRALRDEVRQHYPRGRIVLAVDGARTAAFADGWAAAFAESGAVVFRAPMAGFFRPRGERGAGADAYDTATFRRVLLDPFRTGEGAGFQLAAFDDARDAASPAQWVSAPRDAVLIVDGAFLLAGPLRRAWNWSVFLSGAEAPDDAFERYLRDERPRSAAAAIVDDRDPAAPVRVYEDFC